MRAATFKAIDGSYKIKDIVVSGVFDGVGDEYGQKVNADGSWGDTYYYMLAEGGMVDVDGWYKNDPMGELVSDEDVLGVGESLFFSSGSAIELTYAGQVIDGQPSVSTPAGYSMLGNPSPLSAKISQLEVVGVFDGVGDEYGQKVNADGSWGDTYYYMLADGGMVEVDGWYKNDPMGDLVTDDDVLNAGDALFFSSGADLVIKFPSAL